MSKTVRTNTLKPHQIIMSERFSNGFAGGEQDHRTHVGFDDSMGPFDDSETRGSAHFLVLRSATLRREGCFPGYGTAWWEIEAIRLTDGKILPGAEVIYITAGGLNGVDEVTLVGEAAAVTVDIKPAQ